MAINFYPATALTGGGSDALDAIDGAVLADGDAAFVVTSTACYIYSLNATSGAAESSPDVISPDANAGTKRWILVEVIDFHTHGISDVSGLQSALDGKSDIHTHPYRADTWEPSMSEVTGLVTAMAAKMDTSGDQTMAGKLRLNALGGYLEHGQATPTGSEVLGYNGYFYATRVYNAYLADYADFIELAEPHKAFGKAYIITPEGAKIARERCQKGLIGVATDIYGVAVGQREGLPQIPIAVAGYALAYVDKPYHPGDPLTSDKWGQLTKMTWLEKKLYPERMVGIYMRKETRRFCGPPDNQVPVFGRHWVKVK